MIKFLKRLTIGLLTIVVAMVGLFYLGGYLQTIKSESTVTVSAMAVDADCPGEVCTVLKAEEVNHPDFNYLKGKLIYPYSNKNDFNIENHILELSENGKHKLCAAGYPHKYYIGYLRYFVVGYGGYRMELISLEKQPASGCENTR